MRLILATAGAALALTATAQAAYAPKLSLTLDPTTPNAVPKITSVITQASGETASKTVVVTFPKGFQPNFGGTAKVCSSDQESADTPSCPPDSQLGTAEATAEVLGLPQQLTGNVYFGGPITASKFRLFVILHNDVLGYQRIVGTAELVASGGARNVFDNLPNVLTTSFKLVLNGGSVGLLKNPGECGDYDLTAAFTSQNGEQATGSQKIAIAGCKPLPLSLSGLTLSRTRVRFDVNAPCRVTVTVKRAKKRVATGSFTLAKAGTAVVKVPKLKRGRYVVDVKVTASDGRTLTRRFTRTLR
jgi:methionine-rich copper-binding protein CopC